MSYIVKHYGVTLCGSDYDGTTKSSIMLLPSASEAFLSLLGDLAEIPPAMRPRYVAGSAVQYRFKRPKHARRYRER